MDKAIQAAQKSPKNHDNKWIKPQNEELKNFESKELVNLRRVAQSKK